MVFCRLHAEGFEMWDTDTPFLEPGAEVWPTREAAAARCRAGYQVYSVIAEWEEMERSILDHVLWRHLKHRAEIVK